MNSGGGGGLDMKDNINELDIWSVRPSDEGLTNILLVLGDKLVWEHVDLSLPRVLIQHP